nr:hypothetical protein [Tanacetum cinerariifolium]
SGAQPPTRTASPRPAARLTRAMDTLITISEGARGIGRLHRSPIASICEDARCIKPRGEMDGRELVGKAVRWRR